MRAHRFVVILLPSWLIACAAIPSFSPGVVGPDAEGSEGGSLILDDGGGRLDGEFFDSGVKGDGDVNAAQRKYRVFVTSGRTKPGGLTMGAVKGAEAADKWCQILGDSFVGLGSRWVAFLHTKSTTSRGRLSLSTRVFHRVEKLGAYGPVVFEDIQRPEANLTVPIHDERGEPIAGDAGDMSVRVWVGTTEPTQRCDEWVSQDDADFGTQGIASATDGTWEGRGSPSYSTGCGSSARIYCFEQDP